MIEITNAEVHGFIPSIRGMRNPKNSWDRMDTQWEDLDFTVDNPLVPIDYLKLDVQNNRILAIGDNDLTLMKTLVSGGPVHAKFRRMIICYMDINAPLYWWKEFDTYKVGTVANSCSTMHKIQAKRFEPSDFSFDHIDMEEYGGVVNTVVAGLNVARDRFINTKSKDDWWQMIQLLPSSYNQKRTVMVSYEVLANMYYWRKNHKLDEWRELCRYVETLPYSELITMKGADGDD